MKKILLILPICCLAIFAFGQRDTVIFKKQGAFLILENQSFDENDNLVKQVFMISFRKKKKQLKTFIRQ